MKEEIKAHNNVLELIGNTPLIKLNKITQKMKGNYFAKVEAFNPGILPKIELHFILLKKLKEKASLNLATLLLKPQVETQVSALQW